MSKTVDDYLNEVDYSFDGYIPSEASLKFINFIKLVNGAEGEENKTPVVHYKLLDNIFSGKKKLAILCHRGFAKALALDEVVYTSEGTKTIADVVVGDVVYGEDGLPTKVVGKSPVFNKPMYRITLEDGRSIKVCEDHINTVIHQRQKRVNGKRVNYLDRRDLTTKELLNLKLTTTRSVTDKNPLGKENRVWIPLCSPIQYPAKDLPVDPYTLGLLLGDGSLQSSARLHASAEDMDFYVQHIPYKLGKRSFNGCDYIGVLGVGKLLKQMGVAVHGNFKYIPEEYLIGSVSQRLEVLRGLMDTDGTISTAGAASYCTNSVRLANDVISLVQSLGGIAYYSRIGIAYRVNIQLNQDIFKLPRKRERQNLNSKVKVAITSVERIADEPSQCIAVDNLSKTFVTSNYVVTHNSTICSEYLPLYCAVMGKLEGFGEVSYMLFIGDSLENGCRNMRRNMENRYNTSEFLQQYLPKARFTDTMIEFTNIEGKPFAIRLAGAQQSIRGTRYLNKRPELCIMDDILTDEDARSVTCIGKVKDTIHKGVAKALHPTKNKIVYIGTVFNANDPLYEVIESGSWSPSVFPVCEKFPVEREEFKGSWEDRFPYEAVKEMYEDAVSLGRLSDFNGEMMNRVMSQEDRVIEDGDIEWYRKADLIKRRSNYNFYITTDFATSEKKSADYSVICVWALNNKGQWFLVDGICKRQLMDKNIKDLFRLVQIYSPLGVGIEVTGQQAGFVSWVKQEMLDKNIFFNVMAIRPTQQKYTRFLSVVPWFKQKLIHLPEELKKDVMVSELISELSLVTKGGFKSRHDDMLDGVSLLTMMETWRPSVGSDMEYNKSSGMWEEPDDDRGSFYDSYIV